MSICRINMTDNFATIKHYFFQFKAHNYYTMCQGCVLVRFVSKNVSKNRLAFLPNAQCNIKNLGNFLTFFLRFHLSILYQHVSIKTQVKRKIKKASETKPSVSSILQIKYIVLKNILLHITTFKICDYAVCDVTNTNVSN